MTRPIPRRAVLLGGGLALIRGTAAHARDRVPDPRSTLNRAFVRRRVGLALGLAQGVPGLAQYGEIKHAFSNDIRAAGVLTPVEGRGLAWGPYGPGTPLELGFDAQAAFPHLPFASMARADALVEVWGDGDVTRVFRAPDGQGLMTYLSY
ncbi:MAG: hypothetical protein AAFY65_17200 [Pseudomonadota bacterium]